MYYIFFIIYLYMYLWLNKNIYLLTYLLKESSAYEWIGLDVMDKKSLIKMRNRVGDNTQPFVTTLLIV